MGNTHGKPHPKTRNKKQVHWKAADRPSPPGKPSLSSDPDLNLVTLVWSKPIRDGGSPITGYLVEHRRTGTIHWSQTSPLLVPFPELALNGLEPGWRYQFKVRAENAVGLSDASDISEPLTLSIQKFAIAAPKFTEELKDATVLENEKVEFVVHFLGQPAPKVCWFKDGFEIFSSRRTRISTDGDKSVMTIHQSALSDEGEIKCTATNKAGHASTKARLSLEAPPSIRLPRQYEDGLLFEIGEVLRLKVSVAGRPTPLVFWSHNGETIQNNDRYEMEYVDKCSVLKLGEARRNDRGEYQIKAVNKIGEDMASFLVTITDKPSRPGKARVVMTLGRSVTLSWSIPDDDGGCKIGNYIIEYYRLGWNVWLKAATSRQLSTILGDLIEGSEYKFRVKAESPYGVSEPSEESDIVFIPDAKRGITSPQARSRSQPKDIIEEFAAPVAAKRKKAQPRSQSSTAKIEAIKNLSDEVPKRPERLKIKSPPKTPDLPRKEQNLHNLIDRASLARELAYGSPEIKMKKPEEVPKAGMTLSPDSSPQSKSPTPSPRSQTPSPISENLEKIVDRSQLMEEKSFEDSEFMLVLYPEGNHKGPRRLSQNISFDFNDYDIPPPISLSAPELGAEPPIFENLKTSASSTELLHERAMMRFNEAAAAEEEENRRRKITPDIPRIQINSKDDQEIVGLERKGSRRRSSGSIVQQQLLWAQRRFSLKSPDESFETQKAPEKKKEMVRQRSQSEEMEEEEFEKVRAKMALRGQSSFEKKTIEVVDEDKWLEDYEESLSESETDSSDFEEEPVRKPRIYEEEDEDEETYHPGGITTNEKKLNEPFEILTKKNKLPDPNFVPKPILKKVDGKESVKRGHSPMPNFERERSHSLAQGVPLRPAYQRSISLNQEAAKTEPIDLPKPTVAFGQNISAVATLCGMTVASIVIPEQLLMKKKDEEESKVVVDHYMDIVQNYGNRKGALSNQTWKSIEKHVEDEIKEEPPEPKPVVPKEEPKPVKTQMVVDKPRRSPSPQRGRTSKSRGTTRSKTPSKSPTRLENWAGHAQRKTSPSPMKSVRKSPSPIPLAKVRPPKLREIMTQTSIGLELNYNTDSRSSTPNERSQELMVKAEVKVRGVFDYVTDLSMFVVACWFYLFSNELFAIPVLFFMVFRQLKDEIAKRIPQWMLRRWRKK